MVRYVAGRLAGAVLVVLVVATAVFWLFETLPGDAAETVLSQSGRSGALAGPQLAAVRAELGLDRGALERFGSWMTALARGDLGRSLLSGRPVGEVLGARVADSLVLAAVTLALLVPLATVLGVLAGVRAGRRGDRLLSVGALVGGAVPPFVVAVVLIAVVALGWRLLPAVSTVPIGQSALARPQVLVLPVVTLLVGLVPHPLRVIRARTAELVASEPVRTAGVHGVGRARILARYVAPEALAAAAAPIAGSVTGLVGGVAVVETIFAYPGLAQELVRAVALRDFPVVAAAAVLMAVFGVVVHLLADLAVPAASPQARRAVTGR